MPILGSLGAATAKGVGFTAVPAEFPGVPTIGPAVVTGGVSVNVSYTAPAFDGNTSILSYTAFAFDHPSGTATDISGTASGPGSGSVTVLGLTPGASYTFRVLATNGVGNSELSGPSNNVTTFVVPGAPTIGVVTYTTGNAFASVAFTAPANNGGTPIISYTATAFVSGVATAITGTVTQAGSGSITVNGLVAGTTYTFRVFATNLVGNSLQSGASSAISVFTRPDAPAIGSATYTGGVAASVSFTAPSNNGGATISSYTVRAFISNVATAITASGAASPISITGLTKGTTYTFRVTATNIYGTSDASGDSNAITPLTVPAAPVIGTPLATSGASVDVVFTAPTDTGGISTYITSYTAMSTPGNISVTRTTSLPSPGSASSISITGLTKGQSYTFTVFATNPIGNSAASAASISVTPADVPNAPTVTGVAISTVNTGPSGSVQVSYTAPADNGGAAITSYTATSTPSNITGSISQAGSGTIMVTGLIKGTAYTFVVFATNRVGNSANSNTTAVITPVTVPAAPTIGTATATGPDSATVTLTGPTDTGGSVITNFTATSSPLVSITQSVTSPGVITITSGLVKGASYTFTVTATNAIGTGANSASSNSITTWTEPGAPTIGIATEVNATTATIAFTAGSTGGTPILDFIATAFVSGVATAITAIQATSPITVTGLTQGTTYTFRVAARNIVGTGPQSGASNTVQPADVPSKPVVPTVTTSTTYTVDGRVTILFTAPFDGGTTITEYLFVSNPVTTTRTVTQPVGGTFLFTGLTKGVAYTFAYAARNRIGIGEYSNASTSITPLTIPNAPIIGSAARNDATSVNVSYTASTDNGGTAITGYTATSTPGSITSTSLGNPILVTGLTKGTAYTFTVRANNSRGSSAASSASNSATPATIPNAPTIGTATTVNQSSASITFTAPADNGGVPITSYTAISTPGGISQTISQSGSGTITVIGLSPATAYTFVVYATNLYGNGANSAATNQITTDNSYTVSASPTTINETTSRTVTFTVSTIGVANGTTMFWTNTGTTDAADFTDGVNSGSFIISASGSPPVGTGSVSRTTVTDQFTEGTETIVFNAQIPSGTTRASATVTVNDSSQTPLPTYSIVADKTSINETTDRTVTFSITTEFVPNGTTLFWQLYTAGGVNASDFTIGSTTGSVTILGATGTPATGGTATFSLTATTDQLTEGNEPFFIYLGTNSPASSFNVATSQVITIVDTSKTPGVVSITPTTRNINIVKTGLAVTVSNTYVTTMSSGTVGTITNQEIFSQSVFSSKTVTPTTRTFTGLGQTQTATYTLTTTAVDFVNLTYNITFASILDTGDNYPTHAVSLSRIAYTQNITVSPTSGFTNTVFTYTVTGAPGTQFQYQNSVGGPINTATLSGSAGDAGAGSFSESDTFWGTPGTFTLYVRWLATGHGDSWFGASTGYATNTRVAVTVAYPPVTITATPSTAMSGQIGTPFSGTSTTALVDTPASINASGGSGGTYTYSITSGSQPSGITFSSAGVFGGTPTASGSYSATITATNGTTSGTISISWTIIIRSVITSSSMSTNPAGGTAAYTVGSGPIISWTSSSANTRGVSIRVGSSGQGIYASSGSRDLTRDAGFAFNFQVGSYSVFLAPINLATNAIYTGTEVGYNYQLVAAPTATFTVTPNAVWADGVSTFSASWSSTGGVNWELLVYGASSPFSESGTSNPGPYTATVDETFNTAMRVTNAAGTSVTSTILFRTIYALPTLTASYTTTAITGGFRVTITWSTTNCTSTSSGLQGWNNATSGTYNSDGPGAYGPLPANNYGSFSITAFRVISGLTTQQVTKSVTIVVPGSGTFS